MERTEVARRVVVDPRTGCWRFTGAKTKGGYGNVKINGRNEYAHRVTYELFIGPIPDGCVVDHVAARGCMYRDCCNPDHLEAVTETENIRRGRNTKLTPEIVSVIKARLEDGDTRTEIAQDFFVSWTAVNRIYTGLTWQDVPAA